MLSRCVLIRIPADQDFGRTDGVAHRATVGQRFALPQGRLRRPISHGAPKNDLLQPTQAYTIALSEPG